MGAINFITNLLHTQLSKEFNYIFFFDSSIFINSGFHSIVNMYFWRNWESVYKITPPDLLINEMVRPLQNTDEPIGQRTSSTHVWVLRVFFCSLVFGSITNLTQYLLPTWFYTKCLLWHPLSQLVPGTITIFHRFLYPDPLIGTKFIYSADGRGIYRF